MEKKPSKRYSPHNNRGAGGANDKADFLNPDLLDDETRRLLLKEMRNPATRLQSPSPQGLPLIAPTSPTKSPRNRHPGAKKAETPLHEDGGVYPAQLRAKVNANAVSGSADTLAAMAARLSELETMHRVHKREISELRDTNRKFNDMLQKERKLREDAENLVMTLYDEKKELDEEMTDMKQFFSDYGLQWHGKNTSGAPSRAQSHQPTPTKARQTKSASTSAEAGAQAEKGKDEKKIFDLYEGNYEDVAPRSPPSQQPPPLSSEASTASAQKPTEPPRLFSDGARAAHNRKGAAPVYSCSSPPDIALLVQNARILSDYVGWKGVVVSEGKRAIIRDRDVVTVTVYKNGICVNKGVFRPYGWALCDAFLKDLVEGFYPYEFKDKYPDGFPIEVIDHSREMCEAGVPPSSRERRGQDSASPVSSPSSTPPTSVGAGRRLGGPSPGQPANVHSLLSNGQGGGYAALSKDEFLSRLPAQKVTAHGRLVNVRDGIAGVLAGGETHCDVSSTVKHLSAAEAAERAKGSLDAHEGMRVGDLVAVLVRLPSGQKVTLNVPSHATIGDVREELAAAVPDFAKKTAYELCQAFPDPRVFDNRSATLSELGITRSCTMMIKLLKQA